MKTPSENNIVPAVENFETIALAFRKNKIFQFLLERYYYSIHEDELEIFEDASDFSDEFYSFMLHVF